MDHVGLADRLLAVAALEPRSAGLLAAYSASDFPAISGASFGYGGVSFVRQDLRRYVIADNGHVGGEGAVKSEKRILPQGVPNHLYEHLDRII